MLGLAILNTLMCIHVSNWILLLVQWILIILKLIAINFMKYFINMYMYDNLSSSSLWALQS